MDVGVDKVAVNDVEDLILSETNVNKLDETSRKSVRQSPRLKAQESTRSLRQSTVEKALNPVKVSSPKKTRYSRKDTAVDKVKDEEHVLQLETNDIGSKEAVALEEPNTSPVSSRRSSRIAKKEVKGKINIAENEKEEYSGPANNILSKKDCILGKGGNNSEILLDNDLALLKENPDRSVGEMTEHDSRNSEGQQVVDQEPSDNKAYQVFQPEDKKTDKIYDKVHQELALLSGVECNLDVDTVVNDQCLVPTSDQGSLEKGNKNTRFIPSEVLDPSNNLITKTDTSLEIIAENNPESWEGKTVVQGTENEVTVKNIVNKNKSQNRKGVRKVKPTTGKQLASEENTGKRFSASKDASLNTKPPQSRTKITKNINPQSMNRQEKMKIIKVKKKISEGMKSDKVPLKSKIKNSDLVGKKRTASTPLKQLDDALRDNQGSFKDVEKMVSSRARSRSLSHSSDKAVLKQTPSKGSNVAKDDGEKKEASELSEEKTKLKKSLPPRQRRSSKSISVEEPPLFIPDNIPTVKKEGTEVTLPMEKYIWNPTRHCSSCRKLHGNRFMVGCGRCDDWFHGECVGLTLAQAQQMEMGDREYICAKCCAEEEKMDITEPDISSDSHKIDLHQEVKSLENAKAMMTECHSLTQEKSKPSDDTMKNKEHKVKISKKVSGDSRHSTENKDSDTKKQHISNRKSSATAVHRVSEEKREKSSKEPATSSTHDEKTVKSGVNEKIDVKKRKSEKKGSSSSVPVTSPSTPKPSVDQIRQSVRHSLKDILVKRLSESSSKIPEERATKVSAKIEKELFSFYRDTDAKYKNKYRSLMFNLKDPKNNVLYKRVLKGDITPEHLIKMTPEELASRELAAWRQRENRHTIEMIEKEQREVERRPITKITHKGEIEIESDAPMKEPEAMDAEESVAKPLEKEDVQKEKEDSEEPTSDTTAQHKNHLFDLNCKICTGRMAPPAEALSPKRAKLATNVPRKQSDTEVDNVTEAASTVPGSLDIDMLETEKLDSPKDTFFPTTSSESFTITDSAEDESTFLARLTYIWKGFLNMPSVAKFIIKAYPVSGSLEHLSEDLPESIQVGGRISPQTVWDYVEKIRASGTKETCVIRFTPETEEDQISYTLLYSYFSSRKRYGVVANNMRQVKDMYLIPLGASEKIPHFFVPFDGPGLEARRPNLLLALIIRQKVKRQHSTSIDDEHLGSLLNVPEKKSKVEADDDDNEDDDEENDFFNSFTTVLHKNRNRAQLSDTEEPQAVVEAVPEAVKREPPKPLRFLPGVLVGWENPHSTLDLANKPLPVDILQSLLGTTDTFECKSPSIANNKPLKEEKNQVIDEVVPSEQSSDTQMNMASSTVEETKENPTNTTSAGSSLGLSLKDKPPDVSTEAFLTTVNVLGEEEVDKSLLAEEADPKHNAVPDSTISSVPMVKSNDDDNNVASVDVNTSPIKSPKVIHSKRDPRQAAGRGHHNSASDTKDNESDSHQHKESTESSSRHKKEKSKKHSHEETDVSSPKSRPKTSLLLSSSTGIETDIAEESNTEKPYPPDLLIDETDPLQQFRRALAANKSQAQTSTAPPAENSEKIPAPAFPANFSPLMLPQPSFLPLKSSPPAFPFQHAPGFPLPGNPLFSYAPHIPPLLPTPLGMGFPRPPRFPSAETSIHNPLVGWHPTLQLARPPPHFFGHVTTGPLINTEPVRYQSPQKLYHRDHRGPERRHSDPWDKQDRISDRSSSRGSRSEHRQRFYSESHHSRDKRHEKESGSDKHGDKDSERSRRRDRDRDRKSRDREKERSRTSHSDKSNDSRTSKEGRNDKCKSEDRSHDKDKSRERNKDREEEKDRDRHHKDKSRDHSDKSRSKR
ncbi:PHD finger protein 3 isoform X2 [Dendropsophus ebraccatus]